jgi:hypothetical protein
MINSRIYELTEKLTQTPNNHPGDGTLKPIQGTVLIMR